ncbi:MAG: N-acetylmuramoyl-L-alanine amidase [Bacillota bacterium]|nr:N-acetylmuramoyl-L-alanine amidase [Bacillota bacterium]
MKKKKLIIYFVSLITFTLLAVNCSKTTESSNKNTNATASSSTADAELKTSTGESTAAQATLIATPEAKPSDTENKPSVSTSEPDKAPQVKEGNGKGKVVVIDPGHGGKVTSEKEPISPDSTEMKAKNVGGATGIKTKTPEYVIALNVSMKLKELLEKDGYTVIMTRTTNAETIGNIDRAEIGNKNNADLVIRIHADSSDNSSVTGASMLIPGNVGYAKSISSISKKYGQTIMDTLVDDVKMKDRGLVTRTDLTGFNWSKVPVVLIEMGFLSNPDEDNLLSSDSYQQKLAGGLEDGIKKVFSN